MRDAERKEVRRERKRKTSEMGREAVEIAKGTRRTRSKEMEKQRRQTKQAEKEKKKAIESQKEELRLLAEREVAHLEEEKCAQEHSRTMSEYQQ